MAKKKTRIDRDLVEALAGDTAPADHAATWAWVHHGTGDLAGLPEDQALAAIEAAVRLQNPAALTGLASSGASKVLRKAASAGVHKLKSAGVTVDAGPGRSGGLGEREEIMPATGWLGLPDLDGKSLVVATWSTREEHFVMGAWLYGLEVFKQAFGGAFGRTQLRELWRDLESDEMLQKVPFTTALHVLEHAAQKGIESENFRIFLGQVPADTVRASRMMSPWDVFGPEQPEDLAHGADLAREFRFGFNLDPDQMTQSVLDFAQIGPDGDRTARIDEIARALARVSCTDPEIRGRLAERLEIAALRLRTEEPSRARGAWATACGLRGDTPGDALPFVLEIARTELSQMVGLPEGLTL